MEFLINTQPFRDDPPNEQIIEPYLFRGATFKKNSDENNLTTRDLWITSKAFRTYLNTFGIEEEMNLFGWTIEDSLIEIENGLSKLVVVNKDKPCRIFVSSDLEVNNNLSYRICQYPTSQGKESMPRLTLTNITVKNIKTASKKNVGPDLTFQKEQELKYGEIRLVKIR